MKPQFHPDLYDHVRNQMEAISIDSAENEVVSARDMSRAKEDGGEPDFKNCVHILRDAAHSARRVLSRLFRADAVLEYTYKFFMVIATILQHSDEMRKLYQECTAASINKAVQTIFQHMRAAVNGTDC